MDCTTCCGCELEDHDWSKGACKCYIEKKTGLKPCPFCGGKARFCLHEHEKGYNTYTIECTKCPAIFDRHTAMGQLHNLAKAWNERAQSS